MTIVNRGMSYTGDYIRLMTETYAYAILRKLTRTY